MTSRIGSFLLLGLLVGAPVWSSDSFLRGDVDAKGHVDITDPILNLAFQFLGNPRPLCFDAADTDDSGAIDISDPITSLTFQFLGRPEIPFPGPIDCGDDPTDDALGCERFPICGCLTTEELGQRVIDSFDTLQCILAPALDVELLGTHVLVCPPGLRFCSPSSPGCPMEYRDVGVSFDFAAEVGRISLAGQVARLPVELSSANGTVACHYDVNFDGVLEVPFALITREDGAREIVAVGSPLVDRENTTIDVVLAGPNQCPECVALIQLQELFVEPLIDVLEPDLAVQAAEIGADLIGLAVCKDE
jgi:hypothetical protein